MYVARARLVGAQTVKQLIRWSIFLSGLAAVGFCILGAIMNASFAAGPGPSAQIEAYHSASVYWFCAALIVFIVDILFLLRSRNQ